MCDEYERDAHFALERFQFELHLPPQVGVERGQRLIQQEQPRPVHQSASEGDALLLSPAYLRRFGFGVRRHLDLVERFRDSPADLGVWPLCHAQPVGDVLFDRKMRKKRIALENCVYPPTVWRLRVESFSAVNRYARSQSLAARNG